jgi:hypothetical protein
MVARFAILSVLVGFAQLATPAAPGPPKAREARACECCKDPACPCGCQKGAECNCGADLGDVYLIVGKDAMEKARGVTLYRIAGTALAGRWASLPGNAAVHDERLTFLRALPKDDEEED